MQLDTTFLACFAAAVVWVCRKDWTLLRDDSIFVDWQRLKVQENVEEVSSDHAVGCLPVVLSTAAAVSSISSCPCGNDLT